MLNFVGHVPSVHGLFLYMGYKKFLWLLCVGFLLKAQNLVPNGDFEKYHLLPNEISQWERCVGWTNAGGKGTSDYYHKLGTGNANLPYSYGSYVEPYSNNAIMGLIAWADGANYNAREYIQTKLKQKLRIDKKYRISFWITNGFRNIKYDGFSIDKMGLLFSTKPVTQQNSGVIEIMPQFDSNIQLWDTTWRNLNGYYKADSAYNYITIGNFYDNSQVKAIEMIKIGITPESYYYIDKVEVSPVRAEYFKKIRICKGDPVQLQGIRDTAYQWALATNPDSIISTDSILKVSPDKNIGYLVYGSDTTVTYFDIDIIGRDTNKVGYPKVPKLQACAGIPLKLYPKTAIKGNSLSWVLGNGERLKLDSLHLNDTVSYTYPVPGSYRVLFIRHLPCINDTAFVDLTIKPKPGLDLDPDTAYLCEGGDATTLTAKGTEALGYAWSQGASSSSISVGDTGTYSVVADYGCAKLSDTSVLRSLVQTIPNVITPNGDGLNDVFAIRSNAPLGKLELFNRWGTSLYRAERYDNQWSPEEPGTYFYTYENLGCRAKGWLEVK